MILLDGPATIFPFIFMSYAGIWRAYEYPDLSVQLAFSLTPLFLISHPLYFIQSPFVFRQCPARRRLPAHQYPGIRGRHPGFPGMEESPIGLTLRVRYTPWPCRKSTWVIAVCFPGSIIGDKFIAKFNFLEQLNCSKLIPDRFNFFP